MTQDKARKAAVRTRMAQTGESYTEAARQLADPVSPQDVLDAASREFGIPDGALSLVLRHLREASEYPLLAAGTGDRGPAESLPGPEGLGGAGQGPARPAGIPARPGRVRGAARRHGLGPGGSCCCPGSRTRS
jgi:hypothetical protein